MGYFNGKDVPEGGFTIEQLQAEADRVSAVLRALIAEFTDEANDEPIETGDRKVASRTPHEYLQAGADLCAAAPDFHHMPPRAYDLLDRTFAAQVIFSPVLVLAAELTMRVEEGLVKKKLEALPVARVVHSIARLLVETGLGEWLTAHVEEMDAILARSPSKKNDQKGKKN